MSLARSAAAVLTSAVLVPALLALLLASGSAHAQQLYRWVDEKGRVNITDTPPPPRARNVETQKAAAGGAEGGQVPFELTQAMKSFPVVLYTSPNCAEACAMARTALNKRGVPFKEMQVWDDASIQELKRVSGGNEVPTLTVGRSVQRGFEQSAFDTLLDSARYPRAGILPARTQAAPAAPEGYQPPGAQAQAPAAQPVAEGASEEAEGTARGPYAPKPPRDTQAR